MLTVFRQNMSHEIHCKILLFISLLLLHYAIFSGLSTKISFLWFINQNKFSLVYQPKQVFSGLSTKISFLWFINQNKFSKVNEHLFILDQSKYFA